MDPIARGLALWDEAYKLLESRRSMSATDFERLARLKAGEISSYLQEHDAVIWDKRPDMGAELGKAFDALANGAGEAWESIKPTQFETFVTTLPGEVVKQTEAVGNWFSKLNPKKLVIAAAAFILAVAGVTAWASRRR